jgi:hypothetical protein
MEIKGAFFWVSGTINGELLAITYYLIWHYKAAVAAIGFFLRIGDWLFSLPCFGINKNKRLIAFWAN